MEQISNQPYSKGEPVDYVDRDGDVNIYTGRKCGYDHWKIIPKEI